MKKTSVVLRAVLLALGIALATISPALATETPPPPPPPPEYQWTIEKTADWSELILSPGQQILVTYSVTVSAAYLGGDLEASGDPIDECVDVFDMRFGYVTYLGTVCAGEAPKTFTYTEWVGPFDDLCGKFPVKNFAFFITNDTHTQKIVWWTINVTVPCDGGCTLTPGYWKTHSTYGPAPYDSTWALIGEDTTFFLSGQTYYQVLWTEPQGGNAYYILAHAYIAAKLNMLNGAAATIPIHNAIGFAETVFNTYTPDEVAAMKRDNKAMRDQILFAAEVLDLYNNGYVGTPHCSE